MTEARESAQPKMNAGLAALLSVAAGLAVGNLYWAQPLLAEMGNYWGPAQSMGEEIVAGSVNHSNAAEKTEAMNAAMNTSVVQ